MGDLQQQRQLLFGEGRCLGEGPLFVIELVVGHSGEQFPGGGVLVEVVVVVGDQRPGKVPCLRSGCRNACGGQRRHGGLTALVHRHLDGLADPVAVPDRVGTAVGVGVPDVQIGHRLPLVGGAGGQVGPQLRLEGVQQRLGIRQLHSGAVRRHRGDGLDGSVIQADAQHRVHLVHHLRCRQQGDSVLQGSAGETEAVVPAG